MRLAHFIFRDLSALVVLTVALATIVGALSAALNH